MSAQGTERAGPGRATAGLLESSGIGLSTVDLDEVAWGGGARLCVSVYSCVCVFVFVCRGHSRSGRGTRPPWPGAHTAVFPTLPGPARAGREAGDASSHPRAHLIVWAWGLGVPLRAKVVQGRDQEKPGPAHAWGQLQRAWRHSPPVTGDRVRAPEHCCCYCCCKIEAVLRSVSVGEKGRL